VSRTITQRAVRSAVTTVLAALALVGCGGSSGVKPATYAKSICMAITSWRNEVQNATAHFESTFPRSSSLVVAKQRLDAFVAALLRAAVSGITTTRAAGFPDVNGGQRIATSVVGAFEATQRSLGGAASQASLIPTTGNAAFAAAVGQVRTTVAATLHGMNTVSPGTNPVLRSEIATQPACAALRPPGG
jgi:hypothetical protein